MAKKLVQYLGTGRRKSSVARVYLRAGKGNITINRAKLNGRAIKSDNSFAVSIGGLGAYYTGSSFADSENEGDITLSQYIAAGDVYLYLGGNIAHTTNEKLVVKGCKNIGTITVSDKITKAFSKFEQENERMPSSEELSEMIDVPKDKIADTLRVSGRHVSVDAPFVEGEDNSLLDVLVNNDSPSADRGLVNESLNKEIERALSTLTHRERDIVKSFFGIGCQEMTLEEIGERFGLTRERVRQIKEKAIRRLKNNSKSKLLKSYLG